MRQNIRKTVNAPPSSNEFCNEIFYELANTILKENVEKLKIHAIEAQMSNNAEAIHDMRIAARRLRAALRTFKKILPPATPEIRSELNKWDRILGKKRDLDVFLDFILPMISRGSKTCLKIAHLRDRAQKIVISKLRSKHYINIIEALEDLYTIAKSQNLLILAKNRILEPVQIVLKIAPPLDAEVADKTLHKLRISIKKLRYNCEFFEPVFKQQIPSLSSFIEDTKKIQDILGEHQDVIAGLAMLNHYKKKFTLEEFQGIKQKFEIKNKKTRQRFLKFWKGYSKAIVHLRTLFLKDFYSK